MNYAQHHIERWGTLLEHASAPLAKAADMIRVVKNARASIYEKLGAAHVAYSYCTSILGMSVRDLDPHTTCTFALFDRVPLIVQPDCVAYGQASHTTSKASWH